MNMELSNKKCVPCSGEEVPLKGEDLKKLQDHLDKGWVIDDNKKLRKSFPFENFNQGLMFVQKVAKIAEEEQHHPDICLHYKNVEVELTTHAIGGLSENDFIMASKIDRI
jgi:4a-hydroxytetrahydrobiopterin dehydratase